MRDIDEAEDGGSRIMVTNIYSRKVWVGWVLVAYMVGEGKRENHTDGEIDS